MRGGVATGAGRAEVTELDPLWRERQTLYRQSIETA